MTNSIFIQIASYRDPELLPTIQDCLIKSKYPHNLRFCVAWQHSNQDGWDSMSDYINDDQFTILDIDYRDSKGVCWARNQIQQHYNGEKYTLQLDSHHRFIENWDIELINEYETLLRREVKKPLITSYLPSYEPKNDPNGRVDTPWRIGNPYFSTEGILLTKPTPIKNYQILSKPIPAHFYSGHFTFTSGGFVGEVSHDPNLYFHGEEITIGARAYTHGYDMFHPHKVIAWHEYTRKNRKKHWEDMSSWSLLNKKSIDRVKKLFNDNELHTQYGFGDVRSLDDYELYCGISFANQTIDIDKFKLK